MKNPVIVILLGPPGSGKGTQAPELSQRLKLPHISTGDLFRENIKNQTPIGVVAKKYMDQGQLVPDDVVLNMLFDRLSKQDCQNGAILDGVPRTVNQAEEITKKLSSKVSLKVLQFSIDPELLTERICGRIGCKSCGRPYHKKYNPPKISGVCDFCNGTLIQRADDTEEVLRERLKAYEDLTAPLIDYYQKIGVLKTVNASVSKELVLEQVLKYFY